MPMIETKPIEAKSEPSGNEFSLAKRGKSFSHAIRGVWIFLASTPNAVLQLLIFGVAVCLGVYFSITHTEWIELMLAGGFVLVAETFNRAIEIDIDLTSPGHNELARDTKDVAAGAVLISAVTAAIVGVEIFWHYFVALFA